jgi:phage terminase large subunit-like protein
MNSQSASSVTPASLAEMLALDPTLRAEFFAGLSHDEARALQWNWRGFWARPKQLAPVGAWTVWLILAGRGFGKTKTGAEWVVERVEQGARRIALVAETAADARDVMVEGESGVLACSPPWNRARYEPSKRRVTWANGAVATTFSADAPDQIRGPEHDTAWADEIAKWRYQEAWDNLQFGLRIGADPRVVATTTPKPTDLIRALVKDADCVVTRGATNENRANLSPKFLRAVHKKYAGTRLGRQELEAELLDDAPGALWKRTQIDHFRVSKAPHLVRVVVAIDPSVSADSETAETGIVVAGLGDDGHGYLLADGTVKQPTPEQWGTAAVALYNTHEADRIVGEVNNGGDLVESNVRSIDKNVPFSQVRASRGKAVRAEPVASFGEQGRIHHVGSFGDLEDELCQWHPGSAKSPNRLDAYVWAFTELMLGEHDEFTEALRNVDASKLRMIGAMAR